MICNIVPLPKRNLFGFVSTLQPICVRKDVLEDTYSAGCTYDQAGLNDFNKYKTIERIGDYVVERILYCQEPLFTIKKWWDCHVPIYPIWSKMYRVPFQPYAQVYRYFEGSSYLASCGAVETPLTQTVFCPIWKDLNWLGLGDLSEPKMVELSKIVVPGNDEINLSATVAAKDMIMRAKEGECTSDELADVWMDCCVAPQYLPDPYHQLFGKCPVAAELKPLLSNQYLMQPIIPIKDPVKFETVRDTSFDLEIEFHGLKNLLWRLEESGYTDITINLRRTQNGDNLIDSEMSIFYLGYSTLYQRADFVDAKNKLIEAFRVYASAVMGAYPNPIGVSLIKTWNEEVFVIFHYRDKEDDHYLFDLAALSIGSPSFTDING